MTADLQEPPELAISFFRALESQQFDVAIGTRRDRDDPPLQKAMANLYWRLYRRFVQPEVPIGGVDVFGCNLAVRKRPLRLRESHSTLIGLLFWLGFRRHNTPYTRQPRAAGRSAWTFRRKLRYLLDSCFSLTDLPIVAMMVIGLAGSVVSMLLRLRRHCRVAGAAHPGAWLYADHPGNAELLHRDHPRAGHRRKLRLADIREHQGAPLYVPMIHEIYGRDQMRE